MPGEQCLGRHDIRDLGQSTSAHFLRADGQAPPLTIGKVESPITKLLFKDSIFLGEIVDCELLVLIPVRKACNQ